LGPNHVQVRPARRRRYSEVKYEGHLVVLDDGTRWEVDTIDTGTAELWSAMDHVLVADGEMWKLDDNEKIAVTEDS
jgi:hypothetical protein